MMFKILTVRIVALIAFMMTTSLFFLYNLSSRHPHSLQRQRHRHPKRLLLLFSTWTTKRDKTLVYEETLESWSRLLPDVQPAVFSADTNITRRAAQFGWEVHATNETACGGVPTIRSMFLESVRRHGNTYPLYGFANGDILFDKTLVESVQHVLEWLRQAGHAQSVLLVGKRLNVDANKCLFSNVSDLGELRGHYPAEGSSDYFITDSRFPWKDVPPLVVGRLGFGMWLLAFARARGVTLIDVTQTARAVHMTTRAGNQESSQSENRMCNHRLLSRLKLTPTSFRCGWTDCAALYTARGHVHVRRRHPPPMCHRCNNSW